MSCFVCGHLQKEMEEATLKAKSAWFRWEGFITPKNGVVE
jgi:hypothetical protein